MMPFARFAEVGCGQGVVGRCGLVLQDLPPVGVQGTQTVGVGTESNPVLFVFTIVLVVIVAMLIWRRKADDTYINDPDLRWPF